MATRPHVEPIASLALDCLRAVAMPESQQGMALALAALKSCVDACHQTWPTTPATVWVTIVDDAQVRLRAMKQLGTDNVNIYSKPTGDNGIFVSFLKWQAPLVNTGPAHKLHALLGRAILISATAHQIVSVSLISGISTLNSAAQGKGKRSRDWDSLVKIDLTDPIAVETFRKGVDRSSPTPKKQNT
jgi:hypothetical protein